jgi:hypothetical protein
MSSLGNESEYTLIPRKPHNPSVPKVVDIGNSEVGQVIGIHDNDAIAMIDDKPQFLFRSQQSRNAVASAVIGNDAIFIDSIPADATILVFNG